MSYSTYRKDIDGLRATAVFAVIGYHAFPDYVPGGFIGVDVFFVISGFLISGIIIKDLHRDTFSFADFYARRIRRIFPALLVVCFVCLAFGWLALLPDEYKQLGKHTAAGAAFAANVASWRDAGYFDAGADLKPLLHLWSLSVEEQFYVVWPVLLALFLWRWRSPTVSIAILTGASFALSVTTVADHPVAAFYSSVTRVWELMIGCLLAYLQSRYNEGARGDTMLIANIKSLLGAALIVYPIVTLSTPMAYPGWWTLAPTIGAALTIAAGPTAILNRLVLSHPVPVFFGLISYPLYLWHWPVLSYLRILAPDMQTVMGLWVGKAAAVLLSILLAWLTYEFVERRVRYSARCGIVPALIGGLGLVFCGGLAVYLADGVLARTNFTTDPFRVTEDHLRSHACAKYFNLESLGNDYCVISANTEANASIDLLIGDSHANDLFPAFELAAAKAQRKVAQLGSPGCFPAIGVATFFEHAYDKDRCPKAVGNAIRIAIEDPRVRRIFIAAAWAIYFSGKPYGAAQPERQRLRLDDNTENDVVFQRALGATLDRFARTQKEIYFVHQIPELGFHPKDCLRVRPISFYEPIRSPCSLAISDVLDRQASYRRVVEESLLSRPFIRSLDPVPLLCDERVCDALRSGVTIYRNTDHLSMEGGTLLYRLFEKAMTPPSSIETFGRQKRAE